MKMKLIFLLVCSFSVITGFSQKKSAPKKQVVTSESKSNVSNEPIYDNVKSTPKREEISKAKEATIEDKYKDIIKNNMSEIDEIEKTIQKKKAAMQENQKAPQKNSTELDQARSKMLIDLLGESVFQYYNQQYKPRN